MASIKPFSPLRYTEKAGKIENNVCPPYDIINDLQRERLCERSQYNLVRLELPTGENKYENAKALLDVFKAEGVMAHDDRDGIFIYENEFECYGKSYKTSGLICLCKTYDFSENIVLPHEETLSKAKKDREELMKTTFCNFSPVYSLFTDENKYIRSVIDSYEKTKPLYDFTDDDGVIRRLRKIENEDDINGIVKFFENKQLFIADGHHRYETAGLFHKYCTENGINGNTDYIMMALCDMEDSGLAVLPTHRIVFGIKADVKELIGKIEEDFDVAYLEDVSSAEEELAKVKDRNSLVLYCGGKGYWLLVLKEARMVGQSEVKKLDVSVLHDLILEKHLGIDKDNMKNQKNLRYTRSIKEALDEVDTKKAELAFIMNPTKVSQIKAVSLEGKKMPQKSTYFYPKLISGLTVNEMKINN